MKDKLVKVLHTAVGVVLLSMLVFSNQASAICLADGCGVTDVGSLFGQTQAYDVLVRGNGEAVVTTRISLTNNDTSSLKTVSYHIVSGQLESVVAFQQVSCTDLPSFKPLALSTLQAPAPAPVAVPECYPTMTNSQANASSNVAPSYIYYPIGGTVYKKMTVQQSGNAFSLTVPSPVDTAKSTTFIMSYNLSGISHETLGIHHFTFKTLQSSAPVSDATVALSVDENYVLADAASGAVNYRTPATPSALGANLQAGSNFDATSPTASTISNYVDSIGTNGAVTKHASSLSPNETFTVSSSFASNSFVLYWPRTLLESAVVVLLVAVVIVWYVRNRKRLQGQKPYYRTERPSNGKPVLPQVSPASHQRSLTVRALPLYPLISRFSTALRERRIRPLFIAWMCGLLSVVLTAAVLLAYTALANIEGSDTVASNGLLTILSSELYLGLAVVGFLGFCLFSIGLPLLYAHGLRGAIRIFLHLIVFYIVIVLALTGVLFWYSAASQSQDACTSNGYYCPASNLNNSSSASPALK